MRSTPARTGYGLRSHVISSDDSEAGRRAMSSSTLTLTPIGHVHGARPEVEADCWGGAESRIVLNECVMREYWEKAK